MDARGRALSFAFAAVALPLSVPFLNRTGQDPVGQLEEKVELLQQAVARQELQLAAVAEQVLRLNRLGDAVTAGATALHQATEMSREEGFEWAGPNPQSKTDLLDGLQAFTRSIHKAQADPDEDKKQAPSR